MSDSRNFDAAWVRELESESGYEECGQCSHAVCVLIRELRSKLQKAEAEGDRMRAALARISGVFVTTLSDANKFQEVERIVSEAALIKEGGNV